MKRFSLFLAAAILALAPMLADARPGSGSSSGSRGSRTDSAPPSTNTAPAPARPMERSMTQPTRPGANAPAAAPQGQRSRFGSGFMGGLLGGMLGFGLAGLLFGGGLFGGGAGLGFASMLGLLLQVALIGGLVWLLVSFLRRRSSAPQPAYAGPAQPMMREATPAQGYAGAAGGMPAEQPVQLTEADFQGFERCLQGINAAWSRQDINALRQLATPEMVQYYADDMAQLASRGMRNETRDVKLEQGDLAEAWAENGREYATVAMRYSLLDATFRNADNAVVDGSVTQRTMVTEVWTFVRARGGQWLLSAVQQTA
jgi:predicted lipid-binding transport protein (Tim44 family)